jgi:hypothetical protein
MQHFSFTLVIDIDCVPAIIHNSVKLQPPMISRRGFCQLSTAAALLSPPRAAEAQERFAEQNRAAEWSYTSGKRYADPFNEIELDIVFKAPSGEEHRIPAFWSGGSEWRVRYAAQTSGRYTYRTICSDTSNRDLHDRTGTLTVEPYAGPNSLYRHGFLRVAQDQRHFEHADGTPFFWLGDTWWMGLCNRIHWPDDIQSLAADRVRKGFTVVQIVAGLYPDMPAFDRRGANEAGFPWERDYSRINPAYFDMADLRIAYLVDQGIVPCIVGCWGYFLPLMGVPKMKRHWRYIIARWGAFPTVWCLAGEATMPFYLSKTKEQDAITQRQGWTELARYVRETGLRHPVTLHPSNSARNCVDDQSLLDFDMLQTGHDDRRSIPNTIQSVIKSRDATPKMPVLVGEVCYEGILEASRQEIQRFMFWSSILTGAAGHTYGANGIWQVNTPEQPYGLSPHGHSWGGPPWNIAAQLPGSTQLGLAKQLLSRYSWWKLEPSPEIVEPRWTADNYWQPFAARIPGEAVIVFAPSGMKPMRFSNLESGRHRAFLFNPSDGSEVNLGEISPTAGGSWETPEFPIFRDWVTVLDQRS